MDFLFDTSMNLLKLISGDKQVRVFTIQRGLLNIIGFNWWPGGMNLPLPDFIKFKLFPLFWTLLMVYISLMTMVASVNINSSNDLEFIKKMNGFIVSMPFISCLLKILFFIWMKKEVAVQSNRPLIQTNSSSLSPRNTLRSSIAAGKISTGNGLVKPAIGSKIMSLCVMCENLGKLDLAKEPMIGSLRSCVFYGHLLLFNTLTWSSYYLLGYNDLPFDTDYPWPRDNPSGFSAALLVDMYCALYCGFCHVLVDSMFPICVSITCAHLETLSSFLGKIGSGYWTDHTKLSLAVELHNRLLRVNRQMVKCYSKLFVSQALYTVLHACLCIFAVAKVNDKFAVSMSSLPMLSAAYVQLYLYCYYGQMLTTKFDELSFASYNNEWYRSGTRARKDIILFMEACKRPVSLKAFGSIKASLATYLHSIQESVSYFLILKTITSDAINENM